MMSQSFACRANHTTDKDGFYSLFCVPEKENRAIGSGSSGSSQLDTARSLQCLSSPDIPVNTEDSQVIVMAVVHINEVIPWHGPGGAKVQSQKGTGLPSAEQLQTLSPLTVTLIRDATDSLTNTGRLLQLFWPAASHLCQCRTLGGGNLLSFPLAARNHIFRN